MLAMIAVGVALITMEAQKAYDAKVARGKIYELSAKDKRSIKDGLTNDVDVISDDGQVGNPKSYATACTSALSQNAYPLGLT